MQSLERGRHLINMLLGHPIYGIYSVHSVQTEQPWVSEEGEVSSVEHSQ